MKIEIEKPVEKYDEDNLKDFEAEQLVEIILDLQDRLYKTIDFAEKMLQDYMEGNNE